MYKLPYLFHSLDINEFKTNYIDIYIHTLRYIAKAI
jgi:hypothetical protein